MVNCVGLISEIVACSEWFSSLSYISTYRKEYLVLNSG